mgnify:CR=1 FL=1
MAEAIDEGVLYDVLTKRRAGRFTADELAAKVVVVSRWQDLFNACKQSWFNPDFTEARWPLEPVAVDEAVWDVGELLFDDDVTGEVKIGRLKEMVEKGEIRFCGIRRAMEYVATHLDVQLNHPLVVPVSAQDSVGFLCLPAFRYRWGGYGRRRLALCRVSDGFGRRCGWLVLRKRPKVPLDT